MRRVGAGKNQTPGNTRPLAAAGLFAGLLVSLCLLTLCHAQEPAASQAADREARWRQDLKFFADEFPRRHLDFDKLYPRPGFDAELSQLQGDIPKLSDADIALRLMRLVASANIAHTRVVPPLLKLGFRRLPLTLHWYSDGLAVIAASPDYAAALGTRVLKIGSLTPEQLLARIAPYISHENDAGLQQASTEFFRITRVLEVAGAVGPDRGVTFTLAKPEGQPFTLTVSPEDPRVKQSSAFDAPGVPVPLFRKQPTSYYWYEYLANSKALYIQYNQCAIDPKLAFKDFALEVFAFADSHPVERVVIDLRFNGGGNSLVIYPLLAGLKARPAIASSLYVLIGAGTFSSAQDNAIDLQHGFAAILVGEPSGEKLNSYGEVRQFKLPNSGLAVWYSTKFFRMTDQGDQQSLEPGIRAAFSLVDALAGRDPALEAALRHSPHQPK
jgi:hypothetical protein